MKKHGHSPKGKKSQEYCAWAHMIQRCYNPNDSRYYTYGSRGIKVCERWIGVNGFINFIADMGTKPSKQHSLDRENNDLNYEKSNCRWATRTEQIRNRTNTKTVEHNGEIKSLPEWCDRLGLPYKTVFKRLSDGWSPKMAFTTNIRYMKPFKRKVA